MRTCPSIWTWCWLLMMVISCSTTRLAQCCSLTLCVVCVVTVPRACTLEHLSVYHARYRYHSLCLSVYKVIGRDNAVVFGELQHNSSPRHQHSWRTDLVPNPFSPTLFLIVAKVSLPKRSAPYWSNPPFLIFWHSGTLALSPEHQSAQMSKKVKRVG